MLMETVFVLATCSAIRCAELLGPQGMKTNALRLANQECAPRPALIDVGGPNGLYYPLAISLHRCGGACTGGTSTRTCVNTSTTQLHVHVLNQIDNTNTSFAFINHTACGCSCVSDASVCRDTQDWDEGTCSCICKRYPICKENYQWNPQFCTCECDLLCTHKKKYLNETSCACECKEKVFQKCSRRGKVVDETNDCKCASAAIAPPGLLCDALPPKWAAVIIVMSFFAVVVLAVDCFLYCKGKRSCLYRATQVCLKENENEFSEKQNGKYPTDDEDVDSAPLKTTDTC